MSPDISHGDSGAAGERSQPAHSHSAWSPHSNCQKCSPCGERWGLEWARSVRGLGLCQAPRRTWDSGWINGWTDEERWIDEWMNNGWGIDGCRRAWTDGQTDGFRLREAEL